MNAEYLIIDNHRQRQKVEHIGEVRPDMGRTIFSNTFRIESIRLLGADKRVGSMHPILATDLGYSS